MVCLHLLQRKRYHSTAPVMSFALPGFFQPLGFSPLQADPYFWFEARNGMLDSSGADVAEGGILAEVTDLSGNGRNLTQASTGNRPLAYPSGDGTGYAHFRTLSSGVKHMDCTFNASFTSMKFYSVFNIIGSPTNGGRLFSMGSGGSDTNGQSWIPLYHASGGLIQYHSAGNLAHSGGATAGKHFIQSSTISGAQESNLDQGTTLTGSATLNALDFQRMSIGSNHSGSSSGIDLNIEFVIGVPHTISSTVEEKLVDYITTNFL